MYMQNHRSKKTALPSCITKDEPLNIKFSKPLYIKTIILQNKFVIIQTAKISLVILKI